MTHEVENSELCAGCGGECCRRYPGIYHPNDFLDAQAIVDAIRSGRAVIDWWDGDPSPNPPVPACEFPGNEFCAPYRWVRGYFLRAPCVDERGKTHAPRWGGGVCIHHSSSGCRLPRQQRPHECRLLVPAPDHGECRPADGLDKQALAHLWRPWWPLLDIENFRKLVASDNSGKRGD